MARKLGRAKPYVLTIATADRRKDLESLTVAAARLAELTMELVWAGDSRPYFSDSAVVAGVRSLGYVDDADLPGLYAGARAFVLPSRYEGFGLTCVEAMACAVPVVAADRAALPETCGAALMVDPDDPDAVAECLCGSPRILRYGMISRGRNRPCGRFQVGPTAGRLRALLPNLARS